MRPKRGGVRLVAADAVAPRADRLDVVVVLGEVEAGAVELLAHAGEPLQQRLAALHHDAGVAAQHLRIAGRQVELAAPDIDPHVVVGDVEIGIAGEPEPDHVEQPGDPLIRDLHVDVFEMDGIAEVFRRAVVGLLHVGHSALSPAASISAFWNVPSAPSALHGKHPARWIPMGSVPYFRLFLQHVPAGPNRTALHMKKTSRSKTRSAKAVERPKGQEPSVQAPCARAEGQGVARQSPARPALRRRPARMSSSGACWRSAISARSARCWAGTRPPTCRRAARRRAGARARRSSRIAHERSIDPALGSADRWARRPMPNACRPTPTMPR